MITSFKNDELLNNKTSQRIGFPSAKASMRKVMLEDTALRLPEVLSQIRKELNECQKEKAILVERERFMIALNEIKKFD